MKTFEEWRKARESLEAAEERLHRDLDGDNEKGESAAHKRKVRGKKGKLKHEAHQPTGQPPIDREDYPPIPGLEGPFRFRNGRILYYDPKEGKYYDRKSDLYVDRDELPG